MSSDYEFPKTAIIEIQPTQAEMKGMVEAAMRLMNIKKNEWILKQLSIEQLKEIQKLVGEEIVKRETVTDDVKENSQ